MDKYLYRKRSEWIVRRHDELCGSSRERFVAISMMRAEQMYILPKTAMDILPGLRVKHRIGMYRELSKKVESIRVCNPSITVIEAIHRGIHMEASSLFLSVKRIEMLYNEAVRNGWG